MNNTKNILLIALITATLVLATSIIPMQLYAGKDNNDDHKKGKDFSKIIAGSESDKKSASQHQDQDNVCYRGDECEQANQGQQIVGKDNDAKGFNDQSKNAEASLGAQPTETPTNEPTPLVTLPVGTCSGCFATAFAAAGITQPQINILIGLLGFNNVNLLCAAGTISGTLLHTVLDIPLGGAANVNILIQCLINAGVVITT